MGQLNGVFPAVVIDNVDPKNLGRVQVQLPQMDESGQRGSKVWARMATLMAGKNRGTWFIPDANDEVLVAFEAGDVRRPYVIGSMWNGTSSPPETMDTNNNKKLLRSRNGVTITLDDESGQETFIVETPGGQKVTLKDGPGSIEIMDSNGNSVKLEAAGIMVNASAKVTLNASMVEISSGMVTVNSGMSRFSGVVQCDTLISNSVISASYTPGAGNIF
ncbi:MAG TPA: phage baseplate assembly protein V [Nitrospiraceae bacterium]|nr:phage baseplate assembly protein V [Nitrospiraceae bacterium]